MKSLKSRPEIWARELTLVQRPEVWRTFAVETRLCALFLLEKFEKATDDGEPMRCFFGYKYVRLLFGLSLENLIKGQLLSGPKQERYITTDKISFGSKGHDLPWLLQELGQSIDQEAQFFLEGWAISAEWFGKYPFLLSVNQVLDEYASMPSSEALSRRALRGKRKVMHSDLLHVSIGTKEREAYFRVFDQIEGLYNREPIPVSAPAKAVEEN